MFSGAICPAWMIFSAAISSLRKKSLRRGAQQASVASALMTLWPPMVAP